MEIIRYHLLNLAALLNKDAVNIPKDASGNPIAANTSTVDLVLKVVFGFAGGIALIMIVIGGFKYIASLGNAQNVAKAKDTILYAVVGLIVCVIGYTIVSFVINQVAG
ncbi:hypothetical protein KC957_03885 [Candidatus Saccharibacteria bacterium]|nr:hypothetical protein [Candidatus Saccharibacteria bacterium]